MDIINSFKTYRIFFVFIKWFYSLLWIYLSIHLSISIYMYISITFDCLTSFITVCGLLWIISTIEISLIFLLYYYFILPTTLTLFYLFILSFTLTFTYPVYWSIFPCNLLTAFCCCYGYTEWVLVREVIVLGGGEGWKK